MKSAECKTTAQNLQRREDHQPFFRKGGTGTFFAKQGSASSGAGHSTNAATFFSSPVIQPKLTIGQPNDKYEQEADAMADQVVQKLSHPDVVQRKCAACEEAEEGVPPKLQPKAIFESNEEQTQAKLQRKCSVCAPKPKITPINLQAQSTSVPSLQASSDLESRLNASKNGGSPLPNQTKSSMESAFGADFSGVRVHTNNSSVQMNQQLGAQAFTHGSDIYFNQGKYDTNSSDGQHLLAHELTHVVQQGGALQTRLIQRTTHGRGGASYIPTNCANPLIPLTARMAGVAAHTQIAALFSSIGITPMAIPRATKRLRRNPHPPFGTNLGFADLWTNAGGQVRISEIKTTSTGHGRARREANHYVNRHNQWNARWPNALPDDMAYRAAVGAHPTPGNVLDLSTTTGTGIPIGPFVADPGKVLWIEGDALGALVYWCQGPGIVNPLLVYVLKELLDKLRDSLNKLKRSIEELIDRLPPAPSPEDIQTALAFILMLAALILLVVAVACLAGVITSPCAPFAAGGALVAAGMALLLLGIDIPGITDDSSPLMAALGNEDYGAEPTDPAHERSTNEMIRNFVTGVQTLNDPEAIAQNSSGSLNEDHAKQVIEQSMVAMTEIGRGDESAFIRAQLDRLENLG